MSLALPIIQLSDTSAKPPPTAPPDARIDSNRLIDSHGRTIHDLRLSITDRCNFRCVYCMDPDFRYMPKQELLSLDEYIKLVRVATTLGITKLRLTGGEPTLYSELDALIGEVAQLPLEDLAMTTNGSLVTPQRAKKWKQLGLQRLTFSLDSVDPQRMKDITRSNTTLEAVVRAIDAAKSAGLGPIKVNCVVIRGVNDQEVPDLANFAREHDVDMRYIEFMPLDSSRAWNRSHVVSVDEIVASISARHPLQIREGDDPHSTSVNYRFADGSPGSVGVIAPVSRPFCGACSRLRITADGKVRPCLFSHDEWDIRAVLRSGGDDETLRNYFVDAVWTKQKGHGINARDFIQPSRTMSAIGG